ncbi:hypothetical protein [Caenispirillum salinarum]|uniref:hypothetical protein n=1 Tax=Caenispirillum salinarum TaxID=859058 RepID=UPI00384CA34B
MNEDHTRGVERVKDAETFELTLGSGLAERLRALAARSGHHVEDCLVEAVGEYVATREDFLAAMSHLEEAEERVFLRVVGE